MKHHFLQPPSPSLSLTKQLRVLGLSKTGYYYKPRELSYFDQEVMKEIDKIYTKWPFYGTRRIREELKELDYQIGRQKIGKLMKTMGIEAIYPKKNLSAPNKQHKKYPYLLKDVPITHSNQVWSTDITYIRLRHGFAYLVAIIDWYSRYVLSWRLSTTMDSTFCQEALKEALEITQPEIFNTDQGSQFTDKDFVEILLKRGVKISMDGKGRALDNVFVERLWRTVKYENVYLNWYEGVKECREGLKQYFRFYNNERKHESHGYRRPAEVYFTGENDSKLGEVS